MSRVRPIYDPLRYGYAVGRVRVLETKLLKRSYFERLLDASDFAEQRRILSETVYGGSLEGAITANDVEHALDAGLSALYQDFLETANLPVGIVSYFRTLHDYENLRGRFKAEALGIPAAEFIGPLGSVPAEVFAGPSAGLPRSLAAIEAKLREALTGEDGSIVVGEIDAVVDRQLQAELLSIAQGSGSGFLAELARLGIDIRNARAFIRARIRDLPAASAARWFAPGGSVAPAEYAALYKLPLADAGNRLTALGVFRGLDPEALIDPARFDVAMDSVVTRRLHVARMVAIGPEPVLAYVLAREAEARAVRTLLVGKLAGVSTDVLRSRLRDVA
ncbi:MAG: V-type ATPase subunit [Actinomycetota bacterium]|nr:V-type ATPase subunit [Actinomycetota bacterium]